jgi:2'-5' RNA ligase
MLFTVELYFDPDADAKVHLLYESIREMGIHSSMFEAGYRPHVSLGVCEELDHETFAPELEKFAHSMPALSLSLSHFGTFLGGVLFLGVTATRKLLTVHKDFQNIFERYTPKQASYYLVDQWVPHCTLALGLLSSDMSKALTACYATPLPIHAAVTSIGVVRASPTRYDSLYKFAIP